jgi:hypothetical protein
MLTILREHPAKPSLIFRVFLKISFKFSGYCPIHLTALYTPFDFSNYNINATHFTSWPSYPFQQYHLLTHQKPL